MRYIKIVVCLIFITACSTTKESRHRFSFTDTLLPGMEIFGVVTEESGRDILYITGVRLFSNWSQGWTEGFFEASGKYMIEPYRDTYKLLELDPFELWNITAGEIRYHDTYYRGDDGLWKVKNRVDRLKELSRVLIEDMEMQHCIKDPKEDLYMVLFPELGNFSKLEESRVLPKVFIEKSYPPEIVKGAGVKWRSDYTQALFPEHMWELRNSGTLYRDVQEAPDIFKSIYNLKFYFRNREIVL